MTKQRDPVEELVEQQPGESRAERVYATLLALANRTSYMQIIMCELSWEVRSQRHWLTVRRPDGKPYGGIVEMLSAVWGLDLKPSAYSNRVNLGWAIADWPSTSREWLRRELSELGWSRARSFVTAIRRLKGDCGAMAKLIQRAKATPTSQQVRGLLSGEFGTQRHNAGPTANMCPTCGRVIRPRMKVRRSNAAHVEALLAAASNGGATATRARA